MKHLTFDSRPLRLVLGLFAAAVMGTAANAANPQRLSHLSDEAEELADDLKDEFRSHYRHTQLYHRLKSNADRIESQAEEIHRLARDPYAYQPQLASSLREITDSTHQLRELVDFVESRRYGYVRGNTFHIQGMMNELSNTILEMDQALAVLKSPSYPNSYNPNGPHNPAVPNLYQSYPHPNVPVYPQIPSASYPVTPTPIHPGVIVVPQQPVPQAVNSCPSQLRQPRDINAYLSGFRYSNGRFSISFR
ncbi:MAG: hypothetical protein AAGA96_16790 [Verrucomicrobiota bacterium]